MSDRYILEGHNPVPCSDLLDWGKWMESEDRAIAKETIGKIKISTIFLGLDHAFGGATPILFETMVFGGRLDQYQTRCSTWDEAEKQHAEAIEKVKAALIEVKH